jgi:hypothetical protein
MPSVGKLRTIGVGDVSLIIIIHVANFAIVHAIHWPWDAFLGSSEV